MNCLRIYGMLNKIASIAFVLLACASLGAFQSTSAPAKPAEPDARALTPEEAGRVLNGIYTNQVLGLEVKPIQDWAILGRGEMNVNEAFGREAMGLRLGGGSNKHRVFGMHDGRGSNTSMVIIPIPPEIKNMEDLDVKLIEYAKRDLPNPKVTKETVLLSSGPHVFTGFRVEYALQGRTIYQSVESTIFKDYLVSFTTTSTSPQNLSATLASLKKVITWK